VAKAPPDDLPPEREAALHAALSAAFSKPENKRFFAAVHARVKTHVETAAAAAEWVMSLPTARRPLVYQVRCPRCGKVLLSFYKMPASWAKDSRLDSLVRVVPASLVLVIPAARAVWLSRYSDPPRRVPPSWVSSPDEWWRVRCRDHNLPRVVSARDFIDFGDPK
jgi:hypothetical protein